MKKLPALKPRSTLNATNSTLGIIVAATAILIIAGCVKENPLHPRSITVKAGESIQAAVNTARSGQTIYIEAGTYKEEILVDKQNITLIGLKGVHDEGVTIENPGDGDNGITVRDNGDGFVLRDVTVRDFEENGVFLVRVDGFEITNVITIDNGEYGLFPVRCKNGIIENCSATGHTDTGIYVGQSENVVVRKNVAYGNVNGLEIENCANIVVTNNDAYNNVGGILVILLPGLTVKESQNIVVAHNKVHNNNLENFAPPEDGFEVLVPQGSGILVVGVDNTIVKNNEISNNNFVGVAVVSTLILGTLSGLPPEAFADIEPNADRVQVINNKLTANGGAPPAGIPLPGVDLLWDGTGVDNCWKNNHYATSFPAQLPECE
jgi:parallel beta-helix repeat protein